MATLPATALPIINEALVLCGERPLVALDSSATLDHQRAAETLLPNIWGGLPWWVAIPTLLFQHSYTTALTQPASDDTVGQTPTHAELLVKATGSLSPRYPYRWSLSASAQDAFDAVLAAQVAAGVPSDAPILAILDAVTGERATDVQVTASGIYTGEAHASGVVVVRTGIPGYDALPPAHRRCAALQLAVALCPRIGVKRDQAIALERQAGQALRSLKSVEQSRYDSPVSRLPVYNSGNDSPWLTARI